MAADDVLFASIATVAAGYRNGSLSPVDVTEQTLAQIDARNPLLNAFITVTHDRALAAARRAAEELDAGIDRGLLHGIPIALKDLVDTAGIRTTCGARILADHVPEADAAIVRRLDDAGAVLVGKTNMLEFAYGIVHPDFGPTWNPWDPSRTAGGSSGGSAAAVAAGMCYAAVGTDTGGSIRIPAAYCGVAGLKPTYGRVSLDGIFPLSWSLDHAGPIARTSADAALLLDVLTGRRAASIAPLPLRGRRLVVLTDHRAGDDMDEAAIAAFEDACASLERAGAVLVDASVPDLELAEGAIFPVIGPEASAVHHHWLAARPDDYRAADTPASSSWASPCRWPTCAQQYRRHLTRQLLALLEDTDAILSPLRPGRAPRRPGHHWRRRCGPRPGAPASTT
ncbi:MAG: amidase [Caldilineaceae bacterium]